MFTFCLSHTSLRHTWLSLSLLYGHCDVVRDYSYYIILLFFIVTLIPAPLNDSLYKGAGYMRVSVF